jgi:aminobenzoyl-glutamate utilization protein B
MSTAILMLARAGMIASNRERAMKRARVSGIVTCLAVLGRSTAAVDETTGQRLRQAIEARREHYAEVARQVWGFAELGYLETKSSALLQSELKAAGFQVTSGVAGIPTAFVASWGSGRPIVAFIGEYDALPGLSQDAVAERRPLIAGGPGHGCGHHLLGTASAAAAIAVRDWLAAERRPGTVRYYGTPAEEGGSGKVYMVRAGLFRDVDSAIAWHPGDRNEVKAGTTLANIGAKFRFRGQAAHASASPHEGRSALDGVEAMNDMVNLLREHVPADVRLHYVITRGGEAPNVVPDFAEVYYMARHADIRVLDGVWERVLKAAEGAALGTGTRVEHEVISAVFNMLPNEPLARLALANLERVGGVRYSAEEQAFAERLHGTLSGAAPPLGAQERVLPMQTASGTASTDLGDVSWNVPTVELEAATWVPGTPAHSWQAVACGGTGIGSKGMLVAAKAMALTAADLFTDPAQVEAARADFERRRAGVTYRPRIGDREPALDYRK